MTKSLLVTLNLLWLAGYAGAGRLPDSNLLSNPGFETVRDGKVEGWSAYGKGYEVDEGFHHEGSRSIKCANTSTSDTRGASYRLVLNQKEPAPIIFSAWSRATGVGGAANSDYSLYLDLKYEDGTPLYGQIVPFATGTHDWQRKQVLVVPAKPLREAQVYLLFRTHSGTAWFDDVTVTQLDSGRFFDSQPLAIPKLPRGARGGWFARDVAANSQIQPLSPDHPDASLGLKVDIRTAGGVEEAEVTDTKGTPRAITVYYIERFNGNDPLWWNDIRQSIPTGSSGERTNVSSIGAGATGAHSLYPLGCVTAGNRGRAVAVPPALGPRLCRIGYNATAGLLYAAFDVGLTPDSELNSDSHGHGMAKVAIAAYDVDSAWGFRSATEHYYQLFPSAFERKAKAEGIWMPFTDPSTVEKSQDFGFAYHEGSNSVASDDKLGILSFRYTEPMTWWMNMPPSVPRTYEAAMDIVKGYANGTDEVKKREAQSLLNSGSWDENGNSYVEFQNVPWSNGAAWLVNPNPRIPAKTGKWTKSKIVYSAEIASEMYGAQAKGTLDGEYLDSIEKWAEIADYRPDHIRLSSTPPTFSTETHRPVVMTWFSVWEMASSMRNDLRQRGKLLMGNSTPWRIHDFATVLDVMGTETDWLPGGTWRPDSDAIFNLRRTLCYHKPYLLLQNTNFEKFTTEYVDKYFQKSMFYGCFPSMFSADAANNRYWETPKWYNRDRPYYIKYIPTIQKLSAAGWEPVTYARTDNPSVYVERYGERYFTLLNESKTEVNAEVVIDPAKLGLNGRDRLTVVNMVTKEKIGNINVGRKTAFRISIKPEEAVALSLETD